MSTVLLIDDDKANLEGVSKFLSSKDYRVLTAPSGEKGLQRAAAELPDIVVLDVEMPPGIDGFETLRQLRSNDQTRHIPVIMLTQGSGEAKALYAGAVDYIKQPVNLEVLHARINRRLAQIPPYRIERQSRFELSAVNAQSVRGRAAGRIITPVEAAETLNLNIAALANSARPEEPDWRLRSREKGYDLYRRLIEGSPRILEIYAQLQGEEGNLRLRVQHFPEFGPVPFEYMYSGNEGEGGEYLVLRHSFARTLFGVSVPREPLNKSLLNQLFERSEPLQALLIASNTPPDISGVDDELADLSDILKDGFGRKGITVEVTLLNTESATYRRVRGELERKKYHLIHYAGHGEYDRASPERSSLFFYENGPGGAVRSMPATEVKMLLSRSNAAFVYLSCCEAGSTGSKDAYLHGDFLGIADAVIRAAVPSVLAFRWPVPDDKAAAIAKEFYTALAVTGEIDLALLRARQEVAAPNRDDRSWVSPILYIQD